MPRPRRAFELEMRIGGNTWEDVLLELHEILTLVRQHGPDIASVSGGTNSCHVVSVASNPEMTPEKYRDELNAYLLEIREMTEDEGA